MTLFGPGVIAAIKANTLSDISIFDSMESLFWFVR